MSTVSRAESVAQQLLDAQVGHHLDRLTGDQLSSLMGRIVGEVLQANKAVTDKVPGLGSLMSFGTSRRRG